jgi:hypothetical protein
MPLRKDPMAAAAEAISAIEGTCLGRGDELGELSVAGEALMCTVGSIKVHPNQVRRGDNDVWCLCKCLIGISCMALQVAC